MIVTFIEVAYVFSAIAVRQLAVSVPLAIPEVSFVVADEIVICLTLAFMLVQELDCLSSMAIVCTLAEAPNVRGGTIM